MSSSSAENAKPQDQNSGAFSDPPVKASATDPAGGKRGADERCKEEDTGEPQSKVPKTCASTEASSAAPAAAMVPHPASVVANPSTLSASAPFFSGRAYAHPFSTLCAFSPPACSPVPSVI